MFLLGVFASFQKQFFRHKTGLHFHCNNHRESQINFDHSSTAILYNSNNAKVKKMKEMVSELIEDFDASLTDVYLMIQRDSFVRFKVC